MKPKKSNRVKRNAWFSWAILLTLVLFWIGWDLYKTIQKENTAIADYQYYDVPVADTLVEDSLIAITNEDYLQYGARVAYINTTGDTIIPFGKYAYLGTDTLVHFASVIERSDDDIWGRKIAIDRNQNILFDMILFDNAAEEFHEGLLRALRNGKMGYANTFGQIVIPCIYDYAWWFQNGQAKVTFEARERIEMGEHKRIESDAWFYIDKVGNKIEL